MLKSQSAHVSILYTGRSVEIAYIIERLETGPKGTPGTIQARYQVLYTWWYMYTYSRSVQLCSCTPPNMPPNNRNTDYSNINLVFVGCVE